MCPGPRLHPIHPSQPASQLRASPRNIRHTSPFPTSSIPLSHPIPTLSRSIRYERASPARLRLARVCWTGRLCICICPHTRRPQHIDAFVFTVNYKPHADVALCDPSNRRDSYPSFSSAHIEAVRAAGTCTRHYRRVLCFANASGASSFSSFCPRLSSLPAFPHTSHSHSNAAVVSACPALLPLP